MNIQAIIEQIYRDYKEPVYNYIYRLSNDSNQAQDVVQQTFLKIMTDPGLSNVENMKSYLFTIARNHLYDTWKKKKETLVDDAGIDISASADEGELTEDLASKQRQQAVAFCVQRLTDKFRELMILRYMQDLSINEIASITQLSQSDIKVSLLRARQQFDRGLTQHMYLKVAKSRQQCTEMNAMLTPYREADIPETELTAFEKHIDKCSICAEDAEELKRTRKLLALIPIVSVPLSLDTSMNDAMAASVSISTSVPDGNSAANAVLVKVAVSVAIGVLIIGSIMLLPEKDPVNVPADPPKAAQLSPPPSPQPAKQSLPAMQTAAIGSVPLTATARLTSGAPPAKALWGIYKLSADKKTQPQSIGGANGEVLKKKLDPGQYRITARIDQLEQERNLQVEPGKPLNLDFVFNVSEVKVSTPLTNTINLHDSHLTYMVFKSRKDMETGKHIASKRFKQPVSTFLLEEGDYFLKAKYMGFGKIEATKSFTVIAGESINIDVPMEIGMFKPEAILSGKNLPHLRNISWSARLSSAPTDDSSRFMHINNRIDTPMSPGTYNMTTKLSNSNILQHSMLTIKAGKVTSHKVILKGGILKATVWLDNSKTKRNTKVNISIYDPEKYKHIDEPGTYIPTTSVISNNTPNSFAVLAEGKYTLVVKNTNGHVRKTQDFTVNDGDNKQIDLIIN